MMLSTMIAPSCIASHQSSKYVVGGFASKAFFPKKARRWATSDPSRPLDGVPRMAMRPATPPEPPLALTSASSAAISRSPMSASSSSTDGHDDPPPASASPATTLAMLKLGLQVAPHRRDDELC